MSKRIENVRVKGGMKRYREQHTADPAGLGTIAKAPLVLPPDEEQAAMPPEPQKRSMVAAMVTIHLLALGGFAAFHFIKPSEDKPTVAAELPPVPAPVMPPTASLAAGAKSYVVKGADSWEKIAELHEITVGELRTANPNVSSLTVGGELTVPPKQNIIAAATSEQKPAVSEIATAPAPGAGEKSFMLNDTNAGYGHLLNVLRPGEQAAQRRIAPKQIGADPNVAEAPVVAENTPPAAPLRTIDPPTEAPSPPRPKIVEEAPPKKIVQEQPKSEPRNDTPKVPRAKIVSEPAPGRAGGKPQTVGGQKAAHVVQRGDTLYKVSRDMGISVDELKAINGLTSDNIKNGQTLKGRR
jgi:LysM repeat protein